MSTRPKLILLLLLAAVLLSLMAWQGCTLNLPLSIAWEDPGITMTPAPRTPRPTRTTGPAATATGTIAPTPTISTSGVHVYLDSTSGDNCYQRLLNEEEEVWSTSWDMVEGTYDDSLLVCNFNT